MEFRVSVIIPVFNAEKYVRRAVESALLEEVGEIILVEDGSTDHSLRMCRELSENYPKVRTLRHKDGKNYGPAATRNLGIRKSAYPYIAFLDADDYYLPVRFKKERELFESGSRADGVYGATYTEFESEEAKALFQKDNQSERITLSRIILPEELFKALLWQENGQFSTDAVTLRRSVFEKSGFFNPKIRLGQDTELWYRIAAVGTLIPGLISEPVSVRVIHMNNHIHTPQHIYNVQRRIGYLELAKWILGSKDVSYNNKCELLLVLNVYKRLYSRQMKETGFLFRLLLESPGLLLKRALWIRMYQLISRKGSGA